MHSCLQFGESRHDHSEIPPKPVLQTILLDA